MSGLVHPEWLVPAACLLLAVVLALGLARRRAARRLAHLMGGGAAPGSFTRDAALLLAFAALLAALVGPPFAERERRAGLGVDVACGRRSAADAVRTRESVARSRGKQTSCWGARPRRPRGNRAFASRGVCSHAHTTRGDTELLGGLTRVDQRGFSAGRRLRAALAFEAGSERPWRSSWCFQREDRRRRDLRSRDSRAEVRVGARLRTRGRRERPDHGPRWGRERPAG